MKKTYMTPQMTEEKVKTDFVLRPTNPSQGGGTGGQLAKDRDDENASGDSPIWGDNGRLW